MRRALLALGLLLSCVGSTSAQSIPPLLPSEGLDNPSLAFGLTGISDWGTGRPFVNQMLTARPWFAAKKGEWLSIETDALIAGGYVDDEGWVKSIPPGMEAIRTIWDRPEVGREERAGTYILTYEGEGSIRIHGDARKIDARPGRIVFSSEGGSQWLDIAETDPRGNGEYIRNIAIVAEQDIPLFEAGVVFRPAWIEGIKDARILRFMDWSATNDSRVRPGEEPLIEARGFWRMKQRGVPFALQVELANLLGAEPWFCMPHQADPAYVKAVAEYAYAHVNPDLRVHVEYSNEVWNGGFAQNRWLREQATVNWGLPNDDATGIAFGVREATNDALIWEDVFGADATKRLNNVLSTQTANIWGTGIVLDPKPWAEAEPDKYLPPAAVFDTLGVTTYFGGAFVLDRPQRDELIQRIKEDRASARRWLTERLSDPAAPDTPLSNEAQLRELRRLANESGMQLVAYEGGQHLNHGAAFYGLDEADSKVIVNFLIDYVRGPEMAVLSAQNWDVWVKHGQGPYMHFGDTAAGSKWGSFSLYEFPGRLNPTAEMVLERNRTVAPWWGDTAGDRYLHGRLLRGTDGPNALSGTAKTDILLAGKGDDLINPGPGSDLIHGGEGTDTVLLPALSADVTFRTEGPRRIAATASDLYRLFSVERIRFSDGSEVETPSP